MSVIRFPSTDDASAQILVDKSINRDVRGLRDPRDNLVRNIGRASTVSEHG